MRYLLVLVLAVVSLWPQTVRAAGCENGHYYDYQNGQYVRSPNESCHVVSGGTIMGVACPIETHQTDGGGIGASTADQAARMTHARQCAEWYNATVLGILGNGNIRAGGDGLSENLPVRASAWKP